jgi:hypothetical protein
VNAAAAAATVDRRFLPRGWTDFALQVAIWLGFYFSYQAVRSLADRDPAKAFVNGLRVLRLTSSSRRPSASPTRLTRC